jgi:dTDP-4-amino-4,6-dideoxygalactose transaminase
MLLCRDPRDAHRARTLALHGLSRDAYDRFREPAGSAIVTQPGRPRFRHYQVVEPGFKYNMTDLAAALGLHQLAKVEAHWWRRLHAWRRYDAALSHGLPLTLPTLPASGTDHAERHALHLYTVLVDDAAERDGLLDRMIERRIGVGVHYLALPDHSWYQRELGWRPEAVPVATDIGRRTVSLPLTAGLDDEDLDDVVAALRESLR